MIKDHVKLKMSVLSKKIYSALGYGPPIDIMMVMHRTSRLVGGGNKHH